MSLYNKRKKMIDIYNTTYIVGFCDIRRSVLLSYSNIFDVNVLEKDPNPPKSFNDCSFYTVFKTVDEPISYQLLVTCVSRFRQNQAFISTYISDQKYFTDEKLKNMTWEMWGINTFNAIGRDFLYVPSGNFANLRMGFAMEENSVNVVNLYVGEIPLTLNETPVYISKPFTINSLVPLTENPWGDNSTPEGGDGDFNDDSDDIPFPDTPTLNVSDTGFTSFYEVTQSNLKSLFAFCSSTNFFDNIIKIFEQPLDFITNIHYLPIENLQGITKEIQLGNLNNTGVVAKKISEQIIKVNCGVLNLKEYFGGFYDYSPFTKVACHLPFIGSVPLDIDDVMNANIEIEYTIDIMTGTALCHIKTQKGNLNSVLYSFNTNISTKIPFTPVDYSQVYRAVVSMTASTIGGAVGGGAVASGTANAMLKGGVTGLASSALSNIGTKPIVTKSNQTGGTSGFMGILYPYLEISRPIKQQPKDFNNYVGYPLNVTYKLDDLIGFTQIKSITIEGIPCTKQELDEIQNLLIEGVYL